MNCRAVFCDVDGTLVTSDRRVLPRTCAAIKQLQAKGVPFVIVTARSPSGVYPIQRNYGFQCDIIAYSGGLILDEKGNVLLHRGFPRNKACEIIAFAEENGLDMSWCAYSVDDWIVREKDDPRVQREEYNVRAQSRQGFPQEWPEDAIVNKILCICNPDKILEIEARMRERFPELSIAKSSDILLEIMAGGVTKADAILSYCAARGLDVADTAAFGDNYNDLEMLETAGYGVAMGNAPEEIKRRVGRVTDDNNHDGIANALEKMGIIE